MCTVKISYEDFLIIKANGYSMNIIKHFASRYLKCKVDDIDDVDWNYKLTFNVYMKQPAEQLVDDSLPY